MIWKQIFMWLIFKDLQMGVGLRAKQRLGKVLRFLIGFIQNTKVDNDTSLIL